MMSVRLKNKIGGYTLIEAIVYIVILVIVIMAVVGFVIQLFRSLEAIRVNQDLTRGATFALERLSREIRRAETVNDASSVFGLDPGELSLTIYDENNNATEQLFYVENNILKLQLNNETGINLLPEGVTVSSLIFNNVSGVDGRNIRITLGLMHESASGRTELFTTSITTR